jgi:ATP-dependent Lon protease
MSTPQGPRKRLPENPSDENLRKQAKRLAKGEGLQLAAAQRQLAIEYGYQNWAELMEAVVDRFVPFLPLRGLIAFPHEVYPIYIGRGMSIKAIEAAEKAKSPVLLLAQKDALIGAPSAADMYEVGTLGELAEVVRLSDGTIKTMIEGKTRARVSRLVFDQDFFKAEAEVMEEPIGSSTDLELLILKVLSAFNTGGQSDSKLSQTMAQVLALGDPSVLPDKLVGHLKMPIADKQALLETIHPMQRLETILAHLNASP